MTARVEVWVQLAATLALLAAFAFVCGAWQRADEHANQWENRVVWLESKCEQRPDGSAECRPGAFDVIPTTVAP